MRLSGKLSTISAVILLSLFSGLCPGKIVTAEDVNALSRQAKQVYYEFMKESFDKRMEYVFFGNLPLEIDKQKISAQAEQSGTQLSQLIQRQKKLRAEIENYEGSDWDKLYGANGLWRKLVCDIAESTAFELEIDYYRYLFSPKAERKQIYRQVKDALEKDLECENDYHRFLKARFYFLLDNRQQALRILDKLINSPDTHKAAYRRAKLAKLRHTDTSGTLFKKEINKITEEIENAESQADTELVISLLAEQKKYKKGTELRKVMNKFEAGNYIRSLAAGRVPKLYDNGKPDKITPLEVRLTCLAALEGTNKPAKQTILKLADEKNFRTPLLLYCCSEITKDENKALEYLLEAAKMHRRQTQSWLELEPQTLIRQAVERAYNGLAEGNVDCNTGREVFLFFTENFSTGGEHDLKFKAGCGLLFCGFEGEGKKLLTGLRKNKDAGIWRHKAGLELLKHKAARLNPDNPSYEKLLFEAQELVEQCSLRSGHGYKEFLRKCVNFRCRVLAAEGGRNGAEKILKEISLFSSPDSEQLILKARAYAILGRYPECLKVLTQISKPECGNLRDVFKPLSEVIKRLESSEEKGIANSKRKDVLLNLSKRLQNCLKNRRSALLFAESLVSLSNKQADTKKARQLLSAFGSNRNPDVLRCRGKLLIAEGEFETAAEKWVALRSNIKNTQPAGYKENWFWWQSRFYEFLCWSKLPDSSAKEIVRVIEILENSTAEVPFPWDRKLSNLKNKLKTGVSVINLPNPPGSNTIRGCIRI